MKLNLGSGITKIDGFLNVDKNVSCNPDIVHDLECFPYPFDDSTVSYILLHHVYEHIANAVGMMKELYRICADGATIEIISPYYTWIGAHSDPTHVRLVTKDSFIYYDALRKKMDGSPMTDNLYDFETTELRPIIDEATWQIRAIYAMLVIHKPVRNGRTSHTPN